MNPRKNSKRPLLVRIAVPLSLHEKVKKILLQKLTPFISGCPLEFQNMNDAFLMVRTRLPEGLVDAFLGQILSVCDQLDSQLTGRKTEILVLDERASESVLDTNETALTDNWTVRFVCSSKEVNGPPPSNTILLFQDMEAFGTGLHPSTRLSAQALEYLSNTGRLDSASVMDVGTGSGILSILAVYLGAGMVLALDIDERIVEVARRNFLLNGIKEQAEATTCPLSKLQRPQPDVIVANLTPSVTFDLMEDMVKNLRGQGCLILSGHSLRARDEICQRMPVRGLWMERDFSLNNWSAELFVFRR